MIRHATLADIPRLAGLAEREHARSPWKGELFDTGVTAESMRGFVTDFGKTLLRSEAGYLAGLIQPMGFSAQNWALEFAWYAEDGQGFALLAAFEAWAQHMGARRVIVSDIVSHGRLGAALTARHGYVGLGTTYQKDL